VRLSASSSSIDYGHTASASDEPVGPKFLRITDIQDGRVDWNAVPFCKCGAADEAAAKLEVGNIVIARTGATTGKSFLIRECPDRAVFASYLIRVRPKPNVSCEYLAHFFQTPEYWAQISVSARGATQAGVNATSLKALSLPLPPLAEQRRIAAILDQAEALRAKRRHALAQLDILIQSIFLDLFGDPTTNPKGWPTTRLGEIGDAQGGLQRSASRSHLPREVPYLRVANVYRDALDLREIKTFRATDAEVARTLLVVDDLLIVEGHGNPDEIGRCALWDGSITECSHQNHLIRVRLDRGLVHPVFVSRYLNSAGGCRDLLRAGKTTSGLNTISVSNVRDARLFVPPLPLQHEFATQVSAVEWLKTAQRASLAKLDALFACLQHRAFRGEL
jgi:type I restriction enzyme S subunit